MTPQGAAKKWFLSLRLSTRVGLAAVALLALIGLATRGFAGLLIMIAVVAIPTALYVVITGRGSWASIPSRKTGGIVAGAAAVAFILGGAIAGPTDVSTSQASDVQPTHSASASPKPTPTVAAPEFTDDDPGDPTITVAADGTAAVAIASTDGTKMSAVDLLATLPVKGRAPMTGYERVASFGTAWLDVDHNGCDTRNDILARDLTSTTKSGTCRVLTGQLADPYVDQTISFVRGNTTSAYVQIDHVVALADAWQTGAQLLSPAQRTSLANDPLNLLAVDAKSNAQKGAGDAATWLPAKKSFRCDYVTRQVSVKATYSLWVTQAEHDAIVRVLDTCAGAQAMTSTFTPAPVVAPPVVAAPAPAPAPVAAAPKPAPKPAAPAPAPAPAAPAPAPAPAPAGVTPGAFCPDALVGQSGVAANGRTYVCGGKGADANGHYHWNA